MQPLLTPDALTPSADIRAGLDDHTARLAEAESLISAHQRIEADKAPADDALTAASASHADALRLRALGHADAPSDKETAKRLQAVSTARDDREGKGLAQAAIRADLAPLEAEILRAVEYSLDGLPSRHTEAIHAALLPHIEAPGTALPDLALTVAALQAATGSATLREWLDAVCVPSLRYGAPVLSGTVATVAGQRVNPREAWRSVPELVTLHDAASEPSQVLAKLRAYKPLASRLNEAKPYVRKGWTTDGVTERTDARSPEAPPSRATSRESVHDANRAAALRAASHTAAPRSEFTPWAAG